MRNRHRHLLSVLAVLLAGSVVAACGSASESTGAAGVQQPTGAVSGLSGLRQQANQLLDGGADAFKARLGDLRGHPVVVNQWASWCGPCRFEFPFFARQASKYAGRVAFLGVDSQDGRADAKAFLEEHPVPYPHYFDPDGSIARVFRGGRAFPTTAFYDAAGKLVFTHVGGYATEAKLEDDIRRYAPS